MRYYLLSTHYRSPIEFSEERLAEAAVAYQRLRGVLERAGAWDRAPAGGRRPGRWAEAVAECERLFHEAMDDDFNSAKAIGHLFDLSREVNRALDEGAPGGRRGAAGSCCGWAACSGSSGGGRPGRPGRPRSWRLAGEREQARKAEDWGGRTR